MCKVGFKFIEIILFPRLDGISGTWSTVQQATRIAIIASLVPDEIIYRHSDHSVRSYETALMFIDVSGK